MTLRAHVRTVWPLVRHRLSPRLAPPSRSWETRVDDPRLGPVRLGGRLAGPAKASGLVLLVHGLGGCAESRYLAAAAIAAEGLGLASLRLDLRGSDRRGEDYYHAGLSSDLGEALRSPELSSFRDLFVLGYSLGGHLALHYALAPDDERLRAVAAICAPLDLARSSAAFDRPSRWAYRRYVLGGLRDIYAAVARRREVPIPPAELARVRTLREFDDRVVAPRFGFGGADDYYARVSVGPRLGELAVPALLVAAPDDPMVASVAIESALGGASRRLRVEWVAGAGHVSFSPRLDLGLAGEPGIEGQVLGWLGAQAGTS